MVASLPIAPEVEKKKGCEDAMFNIMNALPIFPFLGLLEREQKEVLKRS